MADSTKQCGKVHDALEAPTQEETLAQISAAFHEGKAKAYQSDTNPYIPGSTLYDAYETGMLDAITSSSKAYADDDEAARIARQASAPQGCLGAFFVIGVGLTASSYALYEGATWLLL